MSQRPAPDRPGWLDTPGEPRQPPPPPRSTEHDRIRRAALGVARARRRRAEGAQARAGRALIAHLHSLDDAAVRHWAETPLIVPLSTDEPGATGAGAVWAVASQIASSAAAAVLDHRGLPPPAAPPPWIGMPPPEAPVRTETVPARARPGVRRGFQYKTVRHITLKSIANNPEIDEIWDRHQPAVRAALDAVDAALGRTHEEWEVPPDPGALADPAAREALAAFWRARTARQREIDESIDRHAERVRLYDQPLVDRRRTRVAGPFTIETLAPPAPAEAAPGTARARQRRPEGARGRQGTPEGPRGDQSGPERARGRQMTPEHARSVQMTPEETRADQSTPGRPRRTSARTGATPKAQVSPERARVRQRGPGTPRQNPARGGAAAGCAQRGPEHARGRQMTPGAARDPQGPRAPAPPRRRGPGDARARQRGPEGANGCGSRR